MTSFIRVRTALVVAGLGIAVMGVAGANAAPFVGKVRTATATFKLLGADNVTYRVTVTLQTATPIAVAGSAQTSLEFDLAKCAFGTCGTPRLYLVPLAAGQGSIADDMSSATVVAVFAGLPLKINWSGAATGVPSNTSVIVGVTGSGVSGGEPGGGSAAAGGTVLGVSCRGEGSISGVILADSAGPSSLNGGQPPNKAPAAFLKTPKAGPSCIRT